MESTNPTDNAQIQSGDSRNEEDNQQAQEESPNEEVIENRKMVPFQGTKNLYFPFHCCSTFGLMNWQKNTILKKKIEKLNPFYIKHNFNEVAF